MANQEGLAYRMYEEYYARAKEADRSGNYTDAKKLYLHAGEELYKAAREVRGETRDMLVRRAEKLVRLSEAIPAAPQQKPAAPPGNPSSSKGQRQENRGGSSIQSAVNDESNTVWTPSEKPNIHFEDIAGLEDVKEAVNSRIILPRKFPEVYKAYKRSMNGGILLYGPPGTGKTMIAKAIATEVNAPFYSVRCSDIVGKYFGEAEKNVKGLFEAARSNDTAVLFFDEFEALAARRGGNSTVMNRLVPELLSQIDGFTTNPDKSLLLLAATNRPWDLDTAFLRPPRLTEKIFVGLPDDPARLYLIQKKLNGVPCSPDLMYSVIVERTEGFNAADVAEFCEYMKEGAIRRTLENEGKELSEISMRDVDLASEHIHSSVQQSDITAIRKWEATQR